MVVVEGLKLFSSAITVGVSGGGGMLDGAGVRK